MNAIARRLLVAVARKLLPDAVPHNPGSALALRSTAALAPIAESRSTILFPIARPLQTLDAPPLAAPAPPPRRRRKVVTETITYEQREW